MAKLLAPPRRRRAAVRERGETPLSPGRRLRRGARGGAEAAARRLRDLSPLLPTHTHAGRGRRARSRERPAAARPRPPGRAGGPQAEPGRGGVGGGRGAARRAARPGPQRPLSGRGPAATMESSAGPPRPLPAPPPGSSSRGSAGPRRRLRGWGEPFCQAGGRLRGRRGSPSRGDPRSSPGTASDRGGGGAASVPSAGRLSLKTPPEEASPLQPGAEDEEGRRRWGGRTKQFPPQGRSGARLTTRSCPQVVQGSFAAPPLGLGGHGGRQERVPSPGYRRTLPGPDTPQSCGTSPRGWPVPVQQPCHYTRGLRSNRSPTLCRP